MATDNVTSGGSTPVTPGQKSKLLAYLFWGFGGWFGLHHFYLGRDRQAFVWWCLLAGYGGVGWFGDLFHISNYVEEANFSQAYIEKLTEKMKKNPKPPFSLYRFIGSIVFGNLCAWIFYSAIPLEETLFGISFQWLHILIPFASAVGVHTVGNIGREKGSLKCALIGAYLPIVFYTLDNPKYYASSVLATCIFRYYCQWNRDPPKRKHICKRFFTISACALLYTSLWCSYLYFNVTITNEDGETIKLRDSIKNLVNSTMFKKFTASLRTLWEYWKVHGMRHFWGEVVKSLDPFGEQSALETLGLPKTATQEEIRKRYKELSRKYHPDKVSDPEGKLEAQAKFVEIQAAYETMSTLSSKRKAKSSRSQSF